MIENEDQYRITRNWIIEFKEARDKIALRTDMANYLRKLFLDSYESQIKELGKQLEEYERNSSS